MELPASENPLGDINVPVNGWYEYVHPSENRLLKPIPDVKVGIVEFRYEYSFISKNSPTSISEFVYSFHFHPNLYVLLSRSYPFLSVDVESSTSIVGYP